MHQTNYLTLSQIIAAAWKGKWVIFTATVTAALISVLAAINMPNQYYSEAVLAPRNDEGLSGLQGQLGGLASLAGLDIGKSNGNQTDIALAVLKSKQFIAEFARKYDIAPLLVAAREWEPATNRIILDPEIYDEQNNKWVRQVEFPYTQEPSDWEIVDRFTQVMKLDRDPENGLVRVGIEFYSPQVAQQWTTWLVDDINNEMRRRDKEQAIRSIEYLQKELESALVDNVRNLFFGLIEEQLKTQMLTEVTPEYAFTVIDPAVMSPVKSAPKRSLIVVICTFLVGFLSTVGVIVFNTSGRFSPADSSAI